jgi:aspartyl-tRNA(Asn)/glutamyl-tRNA(Gln) amidotransferase subunit A
MSPSSYCGVSGLRPTYGRVSRHGAMALCWTLDKLGPMCRSADDCGLVLAAIAGPDPADDTTLPEPYHYAPEQDRSSGFRLAAPADATDSAQDAVAANFRAALDELRAVATIEEVALPDYPYSAAVGAILSGESASAFDAFVASGQVAELTAPEDRVGGYARRFLPAKDYLNAMRLRRVVIREWDALLARYDAFVAPTTLTVASPIAMRFRDYRPGSQRPSLITIGNLIGAPAISVPTGFGERGLPTAIQIMGRARAENTILAIARAYQARTAWHTLNAERGIKLN